MKDITFIVIAHINKKKFNKISDLKNINNIRIKEISAKGMDDAIKQAKNLGASHITFIYDKNLVKNLYNSYKKEPKYIHCNRTSKILLNNDITLKAKKYYKKPSFANKLVGCGGVLYPPNCLYKDVLDEELFMKLAPTNDDIWFWLMAVMNNTKIKLIKHNISSPKEIKTTKNGPCLCEINDKGEKLFYKDLNNVLNHYRCLRDKIINDMD